jgi:hypothetical protein
VYRITYALRVVPARLTRKLAADYDRLSRRTLTAYLRVPVLVAVWDEVTLSVSLRPTGVDITTAASVAPTSYLSSRKLCAALETSLCTQPPLSLAGTATPLLVDMHKAAGLLQAV